MKLPKIAIQNYQFVLTLVFLLILTGVLSYIKMARSEDPTLKVPTYNVIAVYPGTSPEDMEELVVDPIEEAIDELEDIEYVKTQIEEGLAIIRVDAFFSVDVEDKYDEVNAAINNIKSQLPDVYSLEVKKVNPMDVSILQVAFVSENAAYNEMQKVAEKLQDRIKTVSGVREVEVEGYPEKEVRIALDFQKMAQQNIPLQQVIGILTANNVNIPGGSLKAEGKTLGIKTSGSYESLEQLKRTVISTAGEQIVYLHDIAKVYFDYEDLKQKWRFNSQRGIYVNVTQEAGRNIIELNERVQKVVDEFQAEVPASMQMHKAFQQAPAVEARINGFISNLLQGILLVGLIILIFLGARASLIIMTIIPTSIIIAIMMLDISSTGLQQVSIAGLVIALGLLVDNGIVVIENINRYLKEGVPLHKAAYQATSEIGWALVSSTVTTLLSFFPLTQLPKGTGQFVVSLPLIVIFALIASLVLALTFTPLLGRFFLSKKQKTKANFLTKAINSLIAKIYRPSLKFSLRLPVVFLGIAFGLLVVGIMLFPIVGVSFFPTADKPLVVIDIDAPEGTNIDKTDKAVQFVENILQLSQLVQDYNASVGKGNAYVYYNRNPKNFKKNHGQVVVNLKEWTSESFYPFLDNLREQFRQYPDAKISVSELKNGPPFNAPIEIKILGENLDTLKRIAKDFEKILKNTAGTINVDNPFKIAKTDLKVKINRDKVGMLGLSMNEVDLAIRASLTGLSVAEANFEDGEEYYLVLRLPTDKQLSIEDFDKIYINSRSGGQIPLRQIASLEFEAGIAKIEHYNLQRNAVVTANVSNPDKTKDITEDALEKIQKYPFPKGYGYYVAGEYETQQESFGSLGQIFIAAIIGIFAVLVLQFKSFLQPFVILSAIPLAFSGSIFALFFVGYSFSFFAFIGFTSLVGVVVNNSIILVDYTNQLRAKGLAVKEAIMQSAETRFTPIVLTTLTTILGLLPLTLTGGGLWGPLGWTIIGGMISSTFLTLLIVPILYTWLGKYKKFETEVI